MNTDELLKIILFLNFREVCNRFVEWHIICVIKKKEVMVKQRCYKSKGLHED